MILGWLRFLYNPIAFPAITAYVVSLIFKLVVSSWEHRHINFRTMLKDGGMPSSHTAFVIGLATAIGLHEGTTTVFWVSAAFALVVMRDAMSVRYETGRQGKAINDIIEAVKLKGEFTENELREVVGHTPLQVLIGFLVGFAASWASYALLFSI